MAILNFQKPDKIILQKATDFEAQFEFRPLEPGYGVTIGNALRRVLLSSLEGYAISGITIEGAEHEFATLKGVTEDVTEIILNLKDIVVKSEVDDVVSVRVDVKGPKELKASDLSLPAGVDFVNGDQHIATLDRKSTRLNSSHSQQSRMPSSA